MRVTVSIDAVGETDHLRPLSRDLAVLTAASVTNTQGSLFDVVHRLANGSPMGIHHGGRVGVVEGEEN
jgi:hypothetical protein